MPPLPRQPLQAPAVLSLALAVPSSVLTREVLSVYSGLSLSRVISGPV